MTNLEGNIIKQVGFLYSLRNWIEYAFKQVKDELGWIDFRVTDYGNIEKWWKIVMSAYLLVSLQANYFQLETKGYKEDKPVDLFELQLSDHPNWSSAHTWKSALNNLRLILQPYTFYFLIKPWLDIFKIPKFQRCFLELIKKINQFLGLATLCSSSLSPFCFMTG
jgi:hypothetical protein